MRKITENHCNRKVFLWKFFGIGCLGVL